MSRLTLLGEYDTYRAGMLLNIAPTARTRTGRVALHRTATRELK